MVKCMKKESNGCSIGGNDEIHRESKLSRGYIVITYSSMTAASAAADKNQHRQRINQSSAFPDHAPAPLGLFSSVTYIDKYLFPGKSGIEDIQVFSSNGLLTGGWK